MKNITENEENYRKWRKNIKRFIVQNPLMKWPNLEGESEQAPFAIENEGKNRLLKDSLFKIPSWNDQIWKGNMNKLYLS